MAWIYLTLSVQYFGLGATCAALAFAYFRSH